MITGAGAEIAAGPCPLCADPDVLLHHVEAGRSYHRCERCSLIFLHPVARPSPFAELMRYLDSGHDADDPAALAVLSRLVELLAARLAPGGRGLDFGSGPAPTLGRLLGARGFPTASYDPFFLPDERALSDTYDFVTCVQVIEHAHDPRALLDRLAALVRPGGLVAIETRLHDAASFAAEGERRDQIHVSFFTERTMHWIASAYGWQVELPAPDVAIFTRPPSG